MKGLGDVVVVMALMVGVLAVVLHATALLVVMSVDSAPVFVNAAA